MFLENKFYELEKNLISLDLITLNNLFGYTYALSS